MLFNSWIFLAFFAVTYAAYLGLRRYRTSQNILLLVASYVFYGYWDVRFLALLAISTLVDFAVGQRLHATDDPRRRRLLVTLSACTNLGILGFFKYFDFFVASASELLVAFGLPANDWSLRVLLPVGISFYTFQTMSYTIDIYRGRLEPVRSLVDFALFVSFFPQLVAGPIERARNLLPQIGRARTITAAEVDAGLWLILWGFFKKVVIADRMALIVNPVFADHTAYTGLELVVALLAFTVQIYGDFSGYSDIARGLSKLMGFELMVNFKLPYFAVNPSDFWMRWHVSLSSWLRDYLYIPLGGNRAGTVATQRNLAITMLLGGLWHGAAWNFVIWGTYHGALLAVYRAFDRTPIHADPWRAGVLRAMTSMSLMFLLTVLGWLVFRADSVEQIGYFLTHLHRGAGEQGWDMAYVWFFYSWPLLPVQIAQYASRDLLVVTRLPMFVRGLVYGLLFCGIVLFGVRESIEFIYFQF